jgi:hypothetical protein
MGVLLNIAQLVLSIVGAATGSQGVALALSIVGAVAMFGGGGSPGAQDPNGGLPPGQEAQAGALGAQPLPVRAAVVVPPAAGFDAQPVRTIPADTDRLP